MNRFGKIDVLREFISDLDAAKYGIYWAEFNGERKLFVRNGDSFGVVTFYLGEPLTHCLPEVRDDVVDELLVRLEEIDES